MRLVKIAELLARHRTLALAFAGLGLLAVIGGGWYFYTYSQEAALLRANPDSLPQQPGLMAFGTSHGEGVFRTNCAGCHGQQAQGDPSRGVPNLSDSDWMYGVGRISEIQQTVRYGIRAQNPRGRHAADMPAYAQPIPYPREPEMKPLAPDDVSDVVEYLIANHDPAADAQAAARGKEIFNGRGGCWDCHGDNARGDEAIGSSNLADNIWIYGNGSRNDIATSIEVGRQGVCPAWVDRLSPAKILEASLYVYSLSASARAQ